MGALVLHVPFSVAIVATDWSTNLILTLPRSLTPPGFHLLLRAVVVVLRVRLLVSVAFVAVVVVVVADGPPDDNPPFFRLVHIALESAPSRSIVSAR